VRAARNLSSSARTFLRARITDSVVGLEQLNHLGGDRAAAALGAFADECKALIVMGVEEPEARKVIANRALPDRRFAGYNERFRRSVFVLTIRLSRFGKRKKPFYRVVVIESSKARNGRVVELVGTYDPLKKPAEIKLDAERVKYWLGTGAQPSDTVRSFIRQQKIA
jgi:small subunit ribosomal protein S16